MALLSIRNLSRIFTAGDSEVRALDNVSLEIEQGEFVAIIGKSGSGKSTLMNIIGCLDSPTEGTYSIAGQSVSTFSPSKLASVRRHLFGFIFQRYNLLPDITAAENVELPAMYSGVSDEARWEKSTRTLEQLGLSTKVGSLPAQLSGGQQQRVSIARALMNDPYVVLADEPTGALDSKSGADVMGILRELHASGRTVIVITHDESIAQQADRQIEIADGRIIRDPVPDSKRVKKEAPNTQKVQPVALQALSEGLSLWTAAKVAVKIASTSLRRQVLRTGITLLGIIIGVSAVIVMLAVGAGSQQKIVQQMSAMGTNLMMVMPGAPGIRGGGDIVTLSTGDAGELQRVSGVEVVAPERRARFTTRYGNLDYQSTIQGVTAEFPAARDWKIKEGVFFSARDAESYAPVAVLGETVRKILFPKSANPIGEYIVIGTVPFQVIGIMSSKGASPMGSDQDDVVFIPLTTGFIRLFGRPYLSSLTIKVRDVEQIESVQEAVRQILLTRHRTEDFSIRNMASIIATTMETQGTLTILLGSVAAISLLVGGIGVMNIMLVNVAERTREIGVRVATGAEQKDILLQFNIESAVLCGVGGVIGILLGFTVGIVLRWFGVSILFTVWPPILAFASAFLTGVLFGYLPAKRAASLDPVQALAAE